MKLGICSSAFPKSWSVDEIYAKAKSFGFEGIEWWLTPDGPVNVNSTTEEMHEIRRTAEKYGMELYSVACTIYWGTSLTDNDPEVRARAKAVLKKQIDVASDLGCESILVVPGAVGVDFIANCPIVDYEAAYERAVAWVAEFKDYAKEKKVEIAVENVWNKFLLSPIEMRDFVDKAESDYVGVYFDVGNVVYTGYPEQWIRILGNRIKKIHLKDFVRSIGNLSGFVKLLEGDVDYGAVMAALRDIHYDGWLTAEYSFTEETYSDGVQQIIDAMRKIVSL